jgi:hypothetical protein
MASGYGIGGGTRLSNAILSSRSAMGYFPAFAVALRLDSDRLTTDLSSKHRPVPVLPVLAGSSELLRDQFPRR